MPFKPPNLLPAGADKPAADGAPPAEPAAGAPATPRSVPPPSLFSEAALEQLRAIENVALFADDDARSDDEYGSFEVTAKPRQWWRSRAFKEGVAALVFAGLMAIIGGILYATLRDTKPALHLNFFFYAALPIAYALISWIVHLIFRTAEWWYFREAGVLYLQPLHRPVTMFIWSLCALGWAKLVGGVWGCSLGLCDLPNYREAATTLAQVLICFVLFCLANLLRAVAAKSISRTFYCSAHYKKAQTALENEFFLLALSQPREEVEAHRAAQLSHGMLAGLSLSLSGKRKSKSADTLGTARDASVPASEARDTVGDLPASGGGAAAAADDQQRRAGPAETSLHRRVTAMAAGHPLMRSGSLSRSARARDAGAAGSAGRRTPTLSPRGGAIEMSADVAAAKDVETGLPPLARFSRDPAGTGGGAAAAAAAARRAKKAAPTRGQMERMREAVAIKTLSALIHRYSSQSEEQIKEEQVKAREFAQGLFLNIKGDADRDYIVVDDIAFFMDGPAVARAFAWLDRDHDARIGADEVAGAVVSLVKQRADMAATLQDTDSIVSALALGIGAVLHVVFLAFYLLVFGVDILQGFSTLSTSVLALTFVFGETLKSVFENALYLFVTHAFDVGDIVMLPGETSTFRVRKIGLMTSGLLKGNGDLTVWPNAKLRTNCLVNLTRSSPRSDSVSFLMDAPGKTELLKEKVLAAVKAHCTEGAAASEFSEAPFVAWRDVEPPLKLRLQVSYCLTFSGENGGRAVAARDGVIGAVMRALAEGGASYSTGDSQPCRVKME
ncbi:hypothetical protein Rsub_08631 [Raphidocelis subcapitata]|uniref:EF-hand domain-containing protein n=1 Tax=Raphidocelis subcapitata TaxID=307507 RepID=A0A2V0P7W3_9CHLO|nr:hypothetical protein Rsub_08631 [Raphidocelis subcapitata]|eukprot:GBF95649.1 hypothetical protein Rsub_08631 [Raphidocelis subcapitata]